LLILLLFAYCYFYLFVVDLKVTCDWTYCILSGGDDQVAGKAVVVMGSMGEGKENEDDKGRACAHV
jgi:hypothetical protein